VTVLLNKRLGGKRERFDENSLSGFLNLSEVLFYELLPPRSALLQNQLIIFILLRGLSNLLQCWLLAGKVFENLSLIIG
jgi:hypothetical protein